MALSAAFDPDRLAERLQAEHSARTAEETELTQAAVLLVLRQFGSGTPELLYIKRPDHLRHHPGQVSFPGGRRDPQDASAIECALREAEEEVGLRRESLRVLGTLADLRTVTDFSITPVVAVATQSPELKLSAAEVADHFWMPVEKLCAPRLWRSLNVTRRGATHAVWFFDDAPYTIWGATAAMTRQLLVSAQVPID